MKWMESKRYREYGESQEAQPPKYHYSLEPRLTTKELICMKTVQMYIMGMCSIQLAVATMYW